MATSTKTFSGDLSTAIVGKISDVIDDQRKRSEIEKTKASPEVKTAATKLVTSRSIEDKVQKDPNLKEYISKVFGTELDANIIQTEGNVRALTDQVVSINQGLLNTQKLVINQNELMENKFDQMLGIIQQRSLTTEQAEKSLIAKSGSGIIDQIGKESFGSARTARGGLGDMIKRARNLARLLRFLPFKGKLAGTLGVTGVTRGVRQVGKKFASGTGSKIAVDRMTSAAGKEVVRKKISKQFVKTGAKQILGKGTAKRMAPKIGGKLIQRVFSSPVIRNELLKRLGKKGLGKISTKIAGKSVPVAQTAYGIVEGLARFLMGDPKGFALSMGGAIPVAGYGFTVLDIFRDIDRDAYNQHIEPNLPLPSDRNITDFIQGALGVSPEQYETGTRLQPSFMNNFFERSVVSSAALIASAAGVAPAVNAEIRSSGLGHIPVENLNIRTDIGNISKAFSNNTISKSNLIAEAIPSLPSLSGFGGNDTDNVKEPWKIFGMDLPDLGITEFLGGAISTARDIVWGRKDDGYWGPKWMGIKRGNKNIEPRTTITGQITDPEELAFLKMVRTVEGTIGPDGFNTWAGGRNEMDMTSMTLSEVYDEQTRRMNSGEATMMINGEPTISAAVGAGQFLDPFQVASDMYLNDPKYVPKKWDPDNIMFNKELQIDMMLYSAKKTRGIDVSEPLTLKGIEELEKEWAGIGPHYGQTTRTVEESLQLYNKFLKQIEMTPIEDRKVSQINSTSSEVEESLDSFGAGPTIIIANTTYVSGNDSSSLPTIPEGDNDWVRKYKLYSLAS